MKRNWGKKLLFIFFGKKRDKKGGWPAWVKKTDEERAQNQVWRFREDNTEKWIVSEKIDGTSTTATWKRGKRKKHEFYICSRNVVFDKPDKGCYYQTNVYTEMAEKYHFEEVLEKIANRFNLEWVTLQGETYGEGIQKRDYSIKGHDFAGFNLIFSDRGRLNSYEAKDIMAQYGIPWVPLICDNYVLPATVEEILLYAEGTSAIDGKPREGFVFRSQDGSDSFKAVSNQFLLKYHE
jgi:RNA ligase (TIGR02306 family)